MTNINTRIATRMGKKNQSTESMDKVANFEMSGFKRAEHIVGKGENISIRKSLKFVVSERVNNIIQEVK